MTRSEPGQEARGWVKSGRMMVAVCGLIGFAAVTDGGAATNSFSVVNSGTSAYVINGVNNPNLPLVRGVAYSFQVNASGHPFWIKTIQGTGTGNAYTNGVSGNGTAIGTIGFTVPTNAPSLLFYNCQFHAPMTGQLNIEDPPLVRITGFTVATGMVFTSTGSAALNVQVLTTSNLVTGTWAPVTLLTNTYSNGTNTSTTIRPIGSPNFFQVNQSLP